MAVRERLSKLSGLALRNRREGLTRVLAPLGEVLRGSLMERYLTCGNPDCKCARGERHGHRVQWLCCNWVDAPAGRLKGPRMATRSAIFKWLQIEPVLILSAVRRRSRAMR